jgi:hypothetical protein
MVFPEINKTWVLVSLVNQCLISSVRRPAGISVLTPKLLYKLLPQSLPVIQLYRDTRGNPWQVTFITCRSIHQGTRKEVETQKEKNHKKPY